MLCNQTGECWQIFFLLWNLKSVQSLSSVSCAQRVLSNCLVCEKPEECLLNTEYLIRLCNKLNPYAVECNYCYFCKHSHFCKHILKVFLKMCMFFRVTETADRHPLCMLIWLRKSQLYPLNFMSSKCQDVGLHFGAKFNLFRANLLYWKCLQIWGNFGSLLCLTLLLHQTAYGTF